MSRLDYFAIEEAIKARLDDQLGDGVAVLIEEEVAYVEGQIVVIFLDRRRAPADQQALAAGQQTRFELDFTLWCLAPSYDGVREAAKLRDELIGRVEVALMGDRTLGGTVISSWLDGGDFTNVRTGDDNGFISGGEIRLIASARATTT